MSRAQRVTTCPGCGRAEPEAARWCGDCGAPLDDRPPQPQPLQPPQARQRPPEPPEPLRRMGRRWAWVAAAVLVVTAAAVLVEPGPDGDTTLLGRLDDATGRSSLVAPTDGLQLLWRRPVDLAGGGSTGPPALVDLGDDRVLLGDQVVARGTGATVVDLSAGSAEGAPPVRPDTAGRVAVVGGSAVVVIDASTGRVASRARLAASAWTPTGRALGWVAGAAVFTDASGVLGAVEPVGQVRWVGDPGWSWDGTGHATDWLVVRQGDGDGQRVVAVDGRDGTVARDIGPAEAVHAPVVHGDTVVWVDPLRGVDRGLGHPVRVRGARIGGGQEWEATHLSPTSGRPTTVGVTPVGDSIVVHYWATGDTTAAVWLDPVDGHQVGLAQVRGSGRNSQGWPVAAVVDDGIAHVDAAGHRVRLVDREGTERWAVPAGNGEGVVAHGRTVLLGTPPQGASLQSRLRLVDATTGEVLWDRMVDAPGKQHLVGVLEGHVGVADSAWPVPLRGQSWFALDTGRRGVGPELAAEALDLPLSPDADPLLLGSTSTEAGVRPVLLLPGPSGPGRIIGPALDLATPGLADLLEAEPMAGRLLGTVADGDLAVTVDAGSIVAHDPGTRRERWRVEPSVALHTDRALLLGEVVVTVGVDGAVRAWDRDDGARRWEGPDVATTALTAGGEVVVLGSATGDVVVLGRDGRVQQRLQAGRGPHTPVEDVAVLEGRVVVTVGQEVVVFGRGRAVIDPADRVPVP